jgi:glycosyltransferase involved in cell wall biosynthesis
MPKNAGRSAFRLFGVAGITLALATFFLLHLPIRCRTAMDDIFLSILMPCLNEARTLGTCIVKAQAYLSRHDFRGEIIIADNGSTDGSPAIAQSLGARVVSVEARGYGNALLAGIKAARGKYVIMGDSDDSYDFLELDRFRSKLADGYDLVIGNRFLGGFRPGAMPPLHRFLGNPLLTFLGRTFFGSPVHDFYCGLRGFRREAILSLALTSPGMEFALEMIVKASIDGLAITEVPTILSPDGRDRRPHLRSFRDGWRSLRYYLLMCPRWLFLYPGALMGIVGGLASSLLIFTDIRIGTIVFAEHSLILTAAMTNIGVQSVFFWAFARIVATHTGLLRPDPLFDEFRRNFTLERCLAAGLMLAVSGLAAAVYALTYWYYLSFGQITTGVLIKIVATASFFSVLGFQLIFSSFFIYLLDHAPEKTAGAFGPPQQNAAAAQP